MSHQAFSKDKGILFPSKVYCFAVNYLTHRLLLCDKERIRIYDLERNNILCETNYAEKFRTEHEPKAKISAADAIILHNIWITLLNKKSFVFFDDELSHSRVYQVEPNPVASIMPLTRNFEFITLREDRKLLKFWHYEPVDRNEIERKNDERVMKEQKSQALKLQKLAKQTFKERQLTLQYDEFKNKMLSTQEQEKTRLAAKNLFALEFTLFSKRQIHAVNNKAMMHVSFNDELEILAVSYDNMEIGVYSLFTCELLYMIETFKLQQSSSENFGIVSLAIDQEFLYYCDDKKFCRYDLVLNEEYMIPFPSIGRVVSIHAEKSNQNGGVYLMTSDDMLHCLSIVKRNINFLYEWLLIFHCFFGNLCLGAIIWSEEFEKTEVFSLITTQRQQNTFRNRSSTVSDESSHDLHDNLLNNKFPKILERKKSIPEIASSDRTSHTQKRDMRVALGKLRAKYALDTSSRGKNRLFILHAGSLNAFQLHSPGQIVLTTEKPIVRISRPEKAKIVGRGLESVYGLLESLAIEEAGGKVLGYNCSKDKGNPELDINFEELWDKAIYESTAKSDSSIQLPTSIEIKYAHIDHENRAAVLVSANHIFVILYESSPAKKIIQRSHVKNVAGVILVPKKFEDLMDITIRGSFYVLISTQDGALAMYDFLEILKNLELVKVLTYHKSVLAMKYLEQQEKLVTVGSEGRVRMWMVHNGLDCVWTKDLLWNDISSAMFLSDSDILLGFSVGAVEIANMDWSKELQNYSKLYEYHNSRIKCLSGYMKHAVDFASCCESNYIALWNEQFSTPVKIFSLKEDVKTLTLFENQLEKNLYLFVSINNSLMKLDIPYGECPLSISEDKLKTWTSALQLRAKYPNKITKDPLHTLVKGVSRLIEALKSKKVTDIEYRNSPSLIRFLLNEKLHFARKPIELELVRFLTPQSGDIDDSELWLLDIYLWDMYLKKQSGMNPTLKIESGDNAVEDEVKPENSEKVVREAVKKIMKKYPVLRTLMLERRKEREVFEFHKLIVSLLQECYEGPDKLEDQLDFLKVNYGLQREQIDLEYLNKAMKLAPIRRQKSSSQDVKASRQTTPQLRISTDLRGRFENLSRPQSVADNFSPFNTNTEKFDRGFVSQQSQGGRSKFSKWEHQVSKSISGPLEFPHIQAKEVGKTYEQRKPSTSQDTRNSYQKYSKAKKRSQGSMDSVFFLNLNPSSGEFFMTQTNDSISTKSSQRQSGRESEIQAEASKTVAKPFFFSERHVGNQVTHVYHRDSTPPSANKTNRIDAKWDKAFPAYVPKDFVKLHSQGLQNKENEDLIRHVLRILLKSQHYLMQQHGEKRSGSVQTEAIRPKSVAKPEVDYVSIETKEFILNSNLDQLHVMNRLTQMYEEEGKINLADYFDEKPYENFSLEADFASDNKIVETILTL